MGFKQHKKERQRNELVRQIKDKFVSCTSDANKKIYTLRCSEIEQENNEANWVSTKATIVTEYAHNIMFSSFCTKHKNDSGKHFKKTKDFQK